MRAFHERVSWGAVAPLGGRSDPNRDPLISLRARLRRAKPHPQDCSPRRGGGSAASRGRGTRPKLEATNRSNPLEAAAPRSGSWGPLACRRLPQVQTSPKDPDQTRLLRFFNWPRFVTGELIRRWTLSANRRHAICPTTGGVDASIGYKPASVVSGFILCWSYNRTWYDDRFRQLQMRERRILRVTDALTQRPWPPLRLQALQLLVGRGLAVRALRERRQPSKALFRGRRNAAS